MKSTRAKGSNIPAERDQEQEETNDSAVRRTAVLVVQDVVRDEAGHGEDLHEPLDGD